MKKIFALMFCAALIFSLVSCGGSSAPPEPERSEVAESAARFEADNRCLFTLYDDGSVEAFVFAEDYPADIGSAIATYVINALNADYDDFTVNGWFDGDDLVFDFVVENSEINTSKGFLGEKWDNTLTQDAYETILLMYAPEREKIDAAIEELGK